MWNRFRVERSATDLTQVTIRNAALRCLDLHGVDLDGTSITNCDLSGSDFSGARINGVRFADALLKGCCFRGAELKGTDVDHSCLCEADLSQTNAYAFRIRRSTARGMSLRGANLGREAHLYNCDLTGADLTDLQVMSGQAKRLLLEPHKLALLKARGFTDVALFNEPLSADWFDCEAFTIAVSSEEYGQIVTRSGVYWVGEGRYDIFISYVSRYRDEITAVLAHALENLGLRVWFDDEGLRLRDDNIGPAIEYAVATASLCVVLVTPDFFGRKWTEYELGLMSRKRVVLLLHGLAASDLDRIRPGLSENRVALLWEEGLDRVARKLCDAVRDEPRTLGELSRI